MDAPAEWEGRAVTVWVRPADDAGADGERRDGVVFQASSDTVRGYPRRVTVMVEGSAGSIVGFGLQEDEDGHGILPIDGPSVLPWRSRDSWRDNDGRLLVGVLSLAHQA